MIERVGNILKETSSVENDTVLVTCNSVLKTNGSLVMGKGFAKECCDYDPTLPRKFGSIIQTISHKTTLGLRYGLFISDNMYFGAIQTKYDWRYNSPQELVNFSSMMLANIASMMPCRKFHLPRPGCGNGGLNWELEVKWMFVNVPDNVFIWSKT